MHPIVDAGLCGRALPVTMPPPYARRMHPLDPPQTWLVFGGSGAVGGFLLKRLSAHGFDVLALSRRGGQVELPRLRWIAGSLEQASALDDALQGFAPAVICSAGPLDAFVDWLGQRPPSAGTRVLALSSLSASWKLDSPQPAERALAQRLCAAERALFELCARAEASVCVLRVGLIHGAGVDRSLSPLLRLARRLRVLPWPRGARGLRQPVHADDVARALLAAAARDWRNQAAAACLQLPGPEALDFAAMLRRSFVCETPSPRLLRLPMPGLQGIARHLAVGPNRLGRTAAVAFRLHVDQLADIGDWQRLNIAPDTLRRLGEA
jgi:nucleoside-diphosphate-sugar epimerase